MITKALSNFLDSAARDAVGIASDLTARINAAPGDVILMTEGAGGGTMSLMRRSTSHS